MGGALLPPSRDRNFDYFYGDRSTSKSGFCVSRTRRRERVDHGSAAVCRCVHDVGLYLYYERVFRGCCRDRQRVNLFTNLRRSEVTVKRDGGEEEGGGRGGADCDEKGWLSTFTLGFLGYDARRRICQRTR